MATDLFPGVLREEDLYMGDGGRVFCGRLPCAGSTAHATDTTIAGQPVYRLTVADARHWHQELGRWPRCEGCGREWRVPGEGGVR